MIDRPVEIWQIVRDEGGHDIVLLRDDRGRLLPIEIGVCEAAAIWVRLAPEAALPWHLRIRRPWSHDLIQALLERLNAKLERVVIDGLTNGTFFATLHVNYFGDELLIDARPSDSIALVLRMHAPLFVNDEVLDMAAFLPEETNGEDEGPDEMPGDLPDDLPE
ncbi:MAG: bifunctional nuclease family protein [Armatimonadota bacterium]